MNRYVVVAIAAVVTLASGVGLFGYVSGADDRATEGLDLVPVLVAQADLAEGQRFDQFFTAGLIVQSETVEKSRPATAVVNPEDLQGLLSTRSIAAGQIIVASMFASQEDLNGRAGPPTFANQIDDGSVAVAFSASGLAAVGNLIQPGDLVNMFVQVESLTGGVAADGTPDPTSGAIIPVFQNLRIVAIEKVFAANPEDEVAPANPGGSTYTVFLSPIDAARLMHLTRRYTPLLILVPPDNEVIDFPPIIDLNAFPNGRTPEESAEALREMQADGLTLEDMLSGNDELLRFLEGASLQAVPVAAPPSEAPPGDEQPAEGGEETP